MAMLLGYSESFLVKFIGHSRATKTRELVTILNEFRIFNSEKLLRICKKRKLPYKGIIKCTYEGCKNNWHWVLKIGEMYYDPEFEPDYSLTKDLKAVSFIEIA